MAEPSPWSKLGLLLNLAYSFPVTVMVGVGLGWLLDKKVGTAPWFTVLGFLVGLAGGFSLLFKTVKILEKKRREGPDGRT